MTLDEFVGKGWSDHATDAAGVWGRLPEGIPLVETPQHLFALANLANHVAGEHLGRWDDGIAFLDRLATLALFDANSEEGKGVRRLQAGLEYCAGRKGAAEERLKLAAASGDINPASPRVRMLAVAASGFVGQHRMAEAAAALEDALKAAAYGPDANDPAARALGVTGWNLACEFEDRPTLDDDEKKMMLRAAEVSRRYWEIAGNWMHVERGEYRLALSHLKAGLPEKALVHAQECLRVVEANNGDGGEQFFAHEAIARVRLALNDRSAARTARDAAAAALPNVPDEGFRAYCAGELTKLDAMFGVS